MTIIDLREGRDIDSMNDLAGQSSAPGSEDLSIAQIRYRSPDRSSILFMLTYRLTQHLAHDIIAQAHLKAAQLA